MLLVRGGGTDVIVPEMELNSMFSLETCNSKDFHIYRFYVSYWLTYILYARLLLAAQFSIDLLAIHMNTGCVPDFYKPKLVVHICILYLKGQGNEIRIV